MNLRYSAASVLGDPKRHPNEDAWAADPAAGAFAVCDGVTSTMLEDGSYPPWAGGARAAWLAAGAIAATARALGLHGALAAADRLVAALNDARDDGPIDYFLHDAFNATAVAALIEPDGAVKVACVGDAAALFQPRDGPPRLLTRFQTDAAERLRDEELLGRLSQRERALVFRGELRNRVEPWHGRSGMGFGVLDGTGRYAALTETVDLELRPGDRLYLCSDATGRCLAALAAARQSLPPEAAAVLERTRAWEQQTETAYPDDLTTIIVIQKR